MPETSWRISRSGSSEPAAVEPFSMARFCHRDTNRACNRVPGASPARSRSASSPPTDEVCMGTATGAQLLVRMLKAVGVHHVFTPSGLHIAPIYAACVEEGIGIVDTRHEQAAAHAADATARLTRGIGVCAVTAGAGGPHALSGNPKAFAPNKPRRPLRGAAPSVKPGQGWLPE